MKLGRTANLGALTLVFTLIGGVMLAYIPALVMPVGAQGFGQIMTGQYTGNGGTFQQSTPFGSMDSLRIVTVPFRGQASEAYTTNVIQAAAGQGSFLNGSKWDSGIALERGNFTVTNTEFNEAGVVYFWEAHGR